MIDFSTATMRPGQGRDAWGEQLAAICGRAATLRFGDDSFAATIKMRNVGGIEIAHLVHNAREIAHDERAKLDTRCSHMMLVLQLSGRTLISQGGIETEIGANELAIIDTYRPFVSRFCGATRQLAAYLPSAELTMRCSASAFARPRRWSSDDGIAQLARSTLLGIARSAERLGEEDAVYARQSLIALAHHLVERDRAPRASSGTALPEHRIRAFIDAHLADPELSPAQIASACGISSRRLHRVFADTAWSVCGWIRHRRLEQCRQALLDPDQDGLSITQIAFRWGFNDAAHFSRSFRSAYRQSPRDVRRRLNS